MFPGVGDARVNAFEGDYCGIVIMFIKMEKIWGEYKSIINFSLS